jgi:hypothetical protein
VTRCCPTVAVLSAGLLLAAPLAAVPAPDTGQPYSKITERNVFNLKPPAPPPTVAPPPQPTSNVKLTGILTILAAKKAVLQIADPGKAPESKILKEGEREGEVEVLEINEIEGTVRIKNREQEVLLNFQDHGVKPPTAPAVTTPTNMVMIGGRRSQGPWCRGRFSTPIPALTSLRRQPPISWLRPE